MWRQWWWRYWKWGLKMKIFQGVPYPITKSPLGYLHSQDGVRQIKSDLLVLLLTNPGERVMEPAFGTPLRTLIFEPNDPTLQLQAQNMILNSIKQWEPRIAVQHISITGPPTGQVSESQLNKSDAKQDLENLLMIQIIFVDPQNIKEVQALTLQVPIAGGGS